MDGPLGHARRCYHIPFYKSFILTPFSTSSVAKANKSCLNGIYPDARQVKMS